MFDFLIDNMRIVNVTYFVHGTTTDNEKGIASGWSNVGLSKLGKKQCLKLKEIIKGRKFDVIFCSDLKRATDSAKLVFGKSIKIIKDERLRECDYGDFTREKSEKIDSIIFEHIVKPFPNGESYKDVERGVRSFLKDLLEKYHGKTIAIVSHRAPQLALEVITNGKSWEQAIKEDWRLKEPKEWKAGWDYKLET